MYFLPIISTVTPTAKVNLNNLRDTKFWTDISSIGGYDIVPADITIATNILTADQLINRDNVNMASSVRQGNYSITYESNTKIFINSFFKFCELCFPLCKAYRLSTKDRTEKR
jgi:hypothetical protein